MGGEYPALYDIANAASGSLNHFDISGLPATISVNQSVSFTVTAQDASNSTATGYSGTVHFTSSDSAAVLPANTTLTNGTISEIRQSTGGGVGGAAGAKHNSKHDTMEVEEIHFSFDKIAWEHLIDKTMAEDSFTEAFQ